MFPFATTAPAGHVDTDEESAESAKREVEEEVGLHNATPLLIATEDIIGDSSRCGCNAHRWHALLIVLYALRLGPCHVFD